MSDPRKLADLMSSGPLGELAREVERRNLATAEIRRLLPPEEAAHLLSASINAAGEIVLVMDAPAWAARARYCVANLPSERVRVKVVPRES
jgi:hypothetical protein